MDRNKESIEIPKFKKLSVKEVWQKVKSFDSLKAYFPDLKDNEYPDRQFMWNILSILKPKMTNTLVEDAIKNRGVENEEDKEDLIKIAPEYLQKLLSTSIQKVSRAIISRY